jgi:hypothetical protein
MASFEEMNPGVHKTDGHCERKELGMPDTEATPKDHAPCDGSGSERWGSDAWTETKGEGLTDDTTKPWTPAPPKKA